MRCFEIITLYYILCLILIGIIVGLCSGLFGIGGGFLMVPLQFILLTSNNIDPSTALLVSFATSLSVIIPTSLSSVYTHNKNLNNIIKPGILFGIFGILGGFLGGFLAVRIPVKYLQIIFGILLIIIAIKMFFEKDSETKSSDKKNLNIFYYGIIGIFVGICSGLLGIGGGAVLLPILSSVLGYSFIEAVGISSVFITLTAIGGMSSYIISGFNTNPLPYSLGYVNLLNFIGISVFSIPFAIIGAKLSHKMSGNLLKKIFSLIVILLGIKMMF